MLKTFYLFLGIASLVLFGLGPTLAYIELVPPMAGFLVMVLGCFTGVIVVLAGIGVVAMKGPTIALVAAALGIVPAAFLANSLYKARQFPPINDISTELNYPPEFVHAKTLPENAGRDMAFPKGNAEAIRRAYPTLAPKAFTQDLLTVFGKVNDLAKIQPGWTITHTRHTDNESAIEGVAVSGMFKFRDDFVIRITKANEGCVVDMRSKSRDGQGDFGANAKRIEGFFEALGK